MLNSYRNLSGRCQGIREVAVNFRRNKKNLGKHSTTLAVMISPPVTRHDPTIIIFSDPQALRTIPSPPCLSLRRRAEEVAALKATRNCVKWRLSLRLRQAGLLAGKSTVFSSLSLSFGARKSPEAKFVSRSHPYIFRDPNLRQTPRRHRRNRRLLCLVKLARTEWPLLTPDFATILKLLLCLIVLNVCDRGCFTIYLCIRRVRNECLS